MDAVIEDTPCGIVVFTLDGTIVSANRTFAEWAGRSSDDLESQRIDAFFGGAGRVFFQTHLFPMLRMSRRVEEAFLTLKHAVEGEVPVIFNLSVRDAETKECVGAFFPVRRRNRYEDEILDAKRAAEKATAEKEAANVELRLLRDELEARVESRVQDLRAANVEMEAFNYSIAHDLRTPLRAISSTSQVLIEDLGSKLEPPYREVLQRQSHNAVRMGTLIDDLLRLSRLSRVDFARLPFDMSEIARRVFDDLVVSAHTNGCRVEVQEGMMAQGDAGLIRTVLQSLIENACKFSPKGGTIRATESEGVYSIADEGMGFDMAFAPKIFLPFERLVSDTDFEGTGIGLANVERIVRRHGGRIWAESEPGKGTTFFFTLG